MNQGLSIACAAFLSAAGVNRVAFEGDALNPVLPAAPGNTCETTTLMDGSRMDVWFADAPNFTTLSYSYSDDASSDVYATPAVTCLTDIRFPYVVKSGSTYYLFALKAPGGDFNSDLYCWTSTDKTTWAPANSGNAVLTRGTGVWSRLWNVAVVEISGTAHMWIEISTNDSQGDVGLAYSYSTLATLNFDTHKTAGKVIDRGGNPQALHVPDRNAILLLHGRVNPNTNQWDIRASTVADDADLAVGGNYRLSNSFVVRFTGMHTADPDLVVSGRSRPILLRYCHNQLDSYQLTSGLTFNQLYDATRR